MQPHITVGSVLRPRAGMSTSSMTYARAANGCVICPNSGSTCPLCPLGQECFLRARTCDTCPVYTCAKASRIEETASYTSVGWIVGGVIGGGVAIVLVLVLYYIFIFRKKHPAFSEESDGYDLKYEMDSQNGAGSYAEAGPDEIFSFKGAQGEKQDPPKSRPVSSGNDKNRRRLSSYESFMRPPAYFKRGGGRGGNGRKQSASGGSRNDVGDSNSIQYAGRELLKRDSIATTISTTNASNILPIAYIPGVTIRPTKNNTRSIFLYDEDSVFSDFAAIDTALIVQERADSQLKTTMTAVKAHPRLVDVSRIDEDIAEEDDEGPENISRGSDNVLVCMDNESDSDVDSDIGEITRATSTRRSPVTNVFETRPNSAHVPESTLTSFKSRDDRASSRGAAFSIVNGKDDDDGSKSFVSPTTTKS